MKAILVIDMPKSCEECDYCGFYQDDVEERACLLMEGHFIGKLTEGERDVRCPLKPLPNRKGPTWDRKAQGWNECLEDITK